MILETMVSLIKGNYRNTRDMEVTKGYEIVSAFLRKKANLLTVEAADSLLHLVGATDDPKESVIANHHAFKHFVLYYEMWKQTPIPLQQRVLQFINNLIVNNVQAKFNMGRMRRLSIPILYIFYSP